MRVFKCPCGTTLRVETTQMLWQAKFPVSEFGLQQVFRCSRDCLIKALTSQVAADIRTRFGKYIAETKVRITPPKVQEIRDKAVKELDFHIYHTKRGIEKSPACAVCNL